MNFLSCAGELNHHGKYVCDSMYSILGDDFKRITTSFTDKTRKELGYLDYNNLQYNIDGSKFSDEEIKKWIEWADVIDFGSAPEVYLHEAVKNKKIVFIRIERLLKEGNWKLFVPSVIKKYFRKYTKYRNCENVYFLCVSAYAAADLKKIGVFGNRVLQWAYCPEFIERHEDFNVSEDKVLKIFWCGRFIKWKHPEIAVKIAKGLKENSVPFSLEMAGIGDELDKINNMIIDNGLKNEVKVIGSVPANSMREKMSRMDIFLATSDRNEGWGVVLNEAMNSGCAVIASKDMGAAPILINDGQNGILFDTIDKAINDICELHKNRKKLYIIRNNAYLTIKNNFSPDYYAKTFVDMAKEALNGRINSRKGLGEVAQIRKG